MGLVDENKIDLQPLPAGERLDAADLHRRFAVGPRMGALQDAEAMNALRLEGGDGLIDQIDRGHGEGDALTLVERALR